MAVSLKMAGSNKKTAGRWCGLRLDARRRCLQISFVAKRIAGDDWLHYDEYSHT
jgi:hypothetical protein